MYMNRTLQDHLETLRTRLNVLNVEFMAAKDLHGANLIEAEIRTVRMAIAHFEAAIELEKILAIQAAKEAAGGES
jgi:hypothetical protein